MAIKTPPVLANYHKPRSSNSHNDRKLDSAEETKMTITDLDMKSWKLLKVDLALPLAEDNQDNDTDSDSDSEGEEDATRSFRDQLIEDIIDYGADVNSEEAYTAFTAKFYHDVSNQIRSDAMQQRLRTLLQDLIQARSKQPHRVCVKFILDVAKDIDVPILKEKLTGGDTVLHLAIGNREAGLLYIKFICIVADDQDLADAIGTENDREQSCIDLAINQLFLENPPSSTSITQVLSLQILQELTLKASKATLAKRRTSKLQNKSEGMGNLPLHDLVHIDICRGLHRVCSILQGDCQKCRKQMGASNEYSIAYLDALHTMVKRFPEALRKMNKSNQSPFLVHCHTRNINPITKDWGQLEFTALIAPANVEGEDQAKEDLSVKALPKTKEVHRHDKDDAETGHNKSNGRKPTTMKHQKPEVKLSKTLATIVSQRLLELCLSQKTFSDVCQSSFGEKIPSSELIFKAAPLTAKTTDLRKSLPLEPMLACVELVLDDKQALTLRETREDRVKRFFQWLRIKKGVRRIVKLVVYDHAQAPCRDEVIESCIQNFDIRYLDWNKEDLTVDIVRNAAPNLRELWLSWSGRKSTLFGWCNERYGLRLLEQLGTLYVSVGREWESAVTNETSLEQFKNILKENDNMPRLEVKDGNETEFDDEGENNGVELHGMKMGNLWMEAVQRFCKALQENLDNSKDLKTAMNGAVKVAIIDDGVDLEELKTTEYTTAGWHSDIKAPKRMEMNAWYISDKKHGTEMAKLIQLVWPRLNLYIAKLDTKRQVYKSVAASAAEAINKSIDHGANVISMSWTIYESSASNNDDLEEMKKAMNRAEDQNIIMFCASQDSGFAAHRKPYPASNCNPKTVKLIGSAGVYGERVEYVNPDEVDYLFPGEVAISDHQICNGSSAATALAAGLAGLILWCCALQEKRHMVNEKSKAAAKANDGNRGVEMKAQTRRTGSFLMTATTSTQSGKEFIDFQNYNRMYGLFDTLCSSKANPFVNITSLLHAAASHSDPAGELVRRCRSNAHEFFQ